MADRVPFDLEFERLIKNWREPKPGDVCWLVPAIDEAGTIDPDKLALCVLSNMQTSDPNQFFVSMLHQTQALIIVDRKDLLLSFNKDEVLKEATVG